MQYTFRDWARLCRAWCTALSPALNERRKECELAFLGIAFILAIAYFIEWFDTMLDDKQTAKIERTHQDMYALIDEHYCGHEARERKAQVDAMVGALYKDNGKDYKPKHLKQVTTVEERKKRIKAELNGTADDSELIRAQLLDALNMGFDYPDSDADDWYYEEHTDEEKREHLIKHIMRDGLSREQAEISADEFIAFARGL